MAKSIPILVIDDDPEFQELLESTLGMAGFDVTRALSGKEGLEIAATQTVLSAILLDTTMPEMDGLEVLTKLKQNPETSKIPVVMLTGKTTTSDIENAFDLGADDYITKPVEFRVLAQKVRAILKKLSG